MAKSNRKLIRDAIADAKQMRETAVATARVALEEAFAPQFSALIAQRLREEDEFGDEFEDEDDLEELNNPVSGDAHGSEDGGETDIEGVEKSSFTEDLDDGVKSDADDLTSSGIGDIAPDHGMKSAPGPKDPAGGSGVQSSDIENVDKLGMNEDFDEFEDDEDEDELGLEQDEFGMEDDEEEDDLDLEAVIAELEADLDDTDEFGDEEDELEIGEDDELDFGDEDELDVDVEDELGEDDEIDLDIDDDEDEDEMQFGENWPEDPAGTASDGHGSDEGGENDAEAITKGSFSEGYVEEEFDLEEILREIEDEDDMEDEDDLYAENRSLKTELKEHRDAIIFLRSRLQEMNLLNAKLLYTTKLFRNFNLNNESKLRVVENFDRAGTVREAKLVYTTLAEAFRGGNVPRKKSRKTVTEGIASRPTRSTKSKQVLTEQVDDYYRPAITTSGDELVKRMQKLAGINRRR